LQQVQVTNDEDNDADVPSSIVIQDMFGLLDVEIPAKVNAIPNCATTTEKGPNNVLIAAGESKDICVFISFDYIDTCMDLC